MAEGDGTRRARPPSIRDVARAAGVSITLASFALNGRSGVADATRQRILATAAELGYRANPHAQALRRGRTSTYGLVVRNLANPFFLDVISAAGEVAHEAGATLLTLDSGYSLDTERRHIERLTGYRVAGLAIAPVGSGESVRLWQRLAPGLPAVVLNATVEGVEGVSRVSPDNQQAVALPLRRLAALGHAEVAFLTAPQALMADRDRLRRFRQVARELGIAPRVVPTPLNLEAVQRATGRLLASRRPPTAIVTNSDYTAHAVYKAARELGVRVGPGLSVVGHDDLPTSELLDPPLATLRLDRRALGQALMARLLDGAAPSDHRQPVELVERASMQASAAATTAARPRGDARPTPAVAPPDA